MRDALSMSRLQGLRDLQGDGERLLCGQRSMAKPLRESFAFDEFQNEESPVSAFSQIVNGRHMRMIELRNNSRFTLETTEPLGVARKLFGKDLDGYVALQLQIARAIHLTHASGAQRSEDFECAQSGSWV